MDNPSRYSRKWYLKPPSISSVIALVLSGHQAKFLTMADLIFADQDGIITSVSETPPAHYMVRLQSFSLLTKNNIEKYSTSEFEAGGYKWKLIIHPNGNKTKNITDYVSLYLMLVESSLRHHGSSEVHAIFKIFLLDQNKDNYFTLEAGKGRNFHKTKLEWGFDRFLPLKTFNGHLVNDTCLFGAEIYVYKENNSGKGESLQMIKDPQSCKHTWKIESYSNYVKGDRHESLPFKAGDYKWKIQMYPKATDSHISLYLAIDNPTNLSIGSQVYAEFTLRVKGQIHSIHDVSAEANHWFSPSNPRCGWQRFISLHYFNFLNVKDGVCVLEAEVTIHGTTTAL